MEKRESTKNNPITQAKFQLFFVWNECEVFHKIKTTTLITFQGTPVK